MRDVGNVDECVLACGHLVVDATVAAVPAHNHSVKKTN